MSCFNEAYIVAVELLIPLDEEGVGDAVLGYPGRVGDRAEVVGLAL